MSVFGGQSPAESMHRTTPRPLEKMVGPCGLEPQTSTVSKRGHQVLTTTYKAVSRIASTIRVPALPSHFSGARALGTLFVWALMAFRILSV